MARNLIEIDCLTNKQSRDMKEKQVILRIQTDLYYTADFLRELAAAIEDEGTDLNMYEVANGCAEIEWPDSAYEE